MLYRVFMLLCCLCLIIPLMASGQHASDLSISYSCRLSSTTGWTSGYRPIPGDTLTFTINVLNPSNHLSSSLTVKLSDISNYYGDYMNSQSSSTGLDMLFKRRSYHAANNASQLTWSEGHGFLIARWNNQPPANIKIYIDVYDGAATADFSAQLYGNTTAYAFPIPADSNPQNDVADSFDALYTNVARNGNGDNETGPGSNANNGDGLTYWEEYRGFRIKGTWTALNPTIKDIFAYSDFDGTSYWESRSNLTVNAIGYATNLPATTFKVHVINEDETQARKINYRSVEDVTRRHRVLADVFGTKNRMDQYAISIEEFTAETTIPRTEAWVRSNLNHPTGRIMGVAESRSFLYNSPNAPAGVKPAIIFPVFVSQLPSTDRSAAVKSAIGHEFGHSVFLSHPSFNSPTDIMSTTLTASQYLVSHNSHYNLIAKLKIGAGTGIYKDFIEIASSSSDDDSSSSTTSSSSTSTTSSSLTSCENDETYDYCNDEGDGVCTHNGTSTTNGSCGYRYCLCELATNSGSSSDDSSGDDSSDDDSTSSRTTSRGCSYNFSGQCQDEGDCMNTGNARTSDCGKSNCRCTPPTSTGCNTSYIWAGGTHQCNDAGSCSNTGNASQSTCGRGDCSCS